MEKVEKSKIKFGYKFQRICSRRTKSLNENLKKKKKHSTKPSNIQNGEQGKIQIGTRPAFMPANCV